LLGKYCYPYAILERKKQVRLDNIE
jgi:hypothetical protein